MDTLKYIAGGYRTVSNRHRIIARIDREDWREHMAALHVEGFPGDRQGNLARGMKWVKALGDRAGEHYRRCISKDTIGGVPLRTYDEIQAAGNNLNEYRPKT
jgi:hypothetical protein